MNEKHKTAEAIQEPMGGSFVATPAQQMFSPLAEVLQLGQNNIL